MRVLPEPANIFNALRLTSPATTRVAILGQDPYPTPGHANGLAFSYVGRGPLPASLRNIFKELASDLGNPARTRGDLSDWARQGVLLLNTALTVEAGASRRTYEVRMAGANAAGGPCRFRPRGSLRVHLVGRQGACLLWPHRSERNILSSQALIPRPCRRVTDFSAQDHSRRPIHGWHRKGFPPSIGRDDYNQPRRLNHQKGRIAASTITPMAIG